MNEHDVKFLWAAVAALLGVAVLITAAYVRTQPSAASCRDGCGARGMSSYTETVSVQAGGVQRVPVCICGTEVKP